MTDAAIRPATTAAARARACTEDRTHPRARARAVASAGLLLVVALVTACGGDGGGAVTALTASGAWSRPTPPGATAGVLYLTLTSPTDDELVGVDVPADIAASTSLHETTAAQAGAAMGEMAGMDHGDDALLTMTELPAVPLAAQRTVVFEPGGKHVMLHDLAGPLDAGDRYEATLRFAGHGPVTVEVVVASAAPDPQR